MTPDGQESPFQRVPDRYRPLVEWLGQFEGGLRDEIRAQSERADRAEALLRNTEPEVAYSAAGEFVREMVRTAEVNAERIIEDAVRDAATLRAEAEQVRSEALRDREFLLALRRQLDEANSVQRDALIAAREAVSEVVDAGRGGAAGPGRHGAPSGLVKE